MWALNGKILAGNQPQMLNSEKKHAYIECGDLSGTTAVCKITRADTILFSVRQPNSIEYLMRNTHTDTLTRYTYRLPMVANGRLLISFRHVLKSQTIFFWAKYAPVLVFISSK